MRRAKYVAGSVDGQRMGCKPFASFKKIGKFRSIAGKALKPRLSLHQFETEVLIVLPCRESQQGRTKKFQGGKLIRFQREFPVFFRRLPIRKFHRRLQPDALSVAAAAQ
ncbi:hypothetical protein [Rhizobium sp. RU35A]|uniref:hypothetical protein n=1 Tax=Rhizobium sp. RU35A TaxID=1907414 RepID=UPI00165ED1E0|nr:hypothetical protein [Rhizobium sp. RU35A]